MMQEEFERMMGGLIECNFKEIHLAYMRAGDTINKQLFTNLFFSKSMKWVSDIIEKHEEITALEIKQAEVIKQIEQTQAEFDALIA